MLIRIYARASTKEQDAERALDDLREFATRFKGDTVEYVENESGAKLERPILNKLLNEALEGDILLVESVDRLSRLTSGNFEILKQRIRSRGLRLVVADLPTTYVLTSEDNITSSIMNLINNLLIDLLATMARLDNDKKSERIKMGMKKSGYKATGKKPNLIKHKRITQLLATNAMSPEEIANAVGCGVATVYRVKAKERDKDENI
ncbi:recombinase family protein [Acinetobacter baumannii]|nr:recombinase family protein [Acinetobacter baumannii]